MIRQLTSLFLTLFIPMAAIIWLQSTFLPIDSTANGPACLPGAGTMVLYDGAAGDTPDGQCFEYQAAAFLGPVAATQTYDGANGWTVLDTMPDIQDFAGYAVTPTLAPTLNRTNGFQLDVMMQVVTETHNNHDRSGFSIILLAEDHMGIELSFWADEIWAKEGGTAQLFDHAEGVAFDTTTGLTAVELAIMGDTYTVSVAATAILTGPVRDYTAFEPPLPGLPDPYEVPNLIFLGDDTTSAAAEIRLSFVSITFGTELTKLYLPMVIKP